MFTHKIKRKVLEDGIKVTVEGEKQNIKHIFVAKVSYKELQKVKYEKLINGFVDALEKKIDLKLINDIY